MLFLMKILSPSSCSLLVPPLNRLPTIATTYQHQVYLGTEKGTGTKGPKQQVIFMRSIAHDAAVLTTSEGAVASLAKSLDQLDR